MHHDKCEIAFDELITETDGAWLIEVDGKRHWLPKSECEIDEKRNIMEGPEWLFEKRDLL